MALPKKPGKPYEGNRTKGDYKPSQDYKPLQDYKIDARVHIGHVHLKVANIARVGFEVIERFGEGAAFLSAGGYHHHLAVNTWESLGGSPPPARTTGLYYTAIVYPTRAALAEVLRRVLAAGIALDGAADHGMSESIYLRDPDENGVELYCDRPKESWPRTAGGKLAMYTRPLDLHNVLSEIADVPVSEGPRDL